MQEWFGTAFKSRCSDNFWKFSSKNAWFSSLPVKISAGWKCSSCRMVYAPTWKDFKGKRVEWVSSWKIFEKLVLFSMLEIRKVIRKNLLYRLVLIKKTWIGTLFWVGLLSETQINNILLELHWNCSCIFDDNLLSNF